MDTKELKYIISGQDRISSTFRRVGDKQDRLTGSSDKLYRSNKKLAGVTRGLGDRFSGMSQMMPGMTGNIMSMAASLGPLALGGAAIYKIGGFFKDATADAVKFNAEFRELQNLNIDKTAGEMDKLRGNVLSGAYEKGFDPNKTSRAFYDVESVTGKFGSEVDRIVMKQGEFADVFNADFNSFIEGSAKAMTNFGFGADELDRFNRSAFATMKIGSVTFDQLAKLQSVYAGSAEANKQSFDTANKIFGLMTVATKNPDIAATYTRQAFVDLFKPSMRKSFASQQIPMIDETTGKLRQADKILLDLNKKFAELGGDDRAIRELKDKFAGSEGVNELINIASRNTKELLETLDSFSNADTYFNKALHLANEDVDRLNRKLENKTKVLMISIGQTPMAKWWTDTQISVVDKAYAIIKGSSAIRQEIREKEADKIRSRYDSKLSKVAAMSDTEFEANQAELVKKYQNAIGMRDTYGTDKKAQYKWRMENGGSRLHAKNQLENYYKRWDAKAELYMEYIKKFPAQKSSPLATTGNDNSPPPPGTDDPELKKGLATVSGGGSVVRNVSVVIESIGGNMTIRSENLAEGAEEASEVIMTQLIRSVRGAEQALNN